MATKTEQERLEQLLRGQRQLMEELLGWIADDEKHDAILRATVLGSRGDRTVHIADMEDDRIYHVSSIRRICVKYRLRFLDAGLFKGEVPSQAVHAIRLLERRSKAPLRGFKMMAPSERFRLCDSEVDPFLFVPLGDDRFYLVHRWGKEVSMMRALLGWPFRSAVHLATIVLFIAMVLASVVPTHLLITDPAAGYWGAHRVLFMFWSMMVCSSFAVFGWFAFFGQFSGDAWNSRHFN